VPFTSSVHAHKSQATCARSRSCFLWKHGTLFRNGGGGWLHGVRTVLSIIARAYALGATWGLTLVRADAAEARRLNKTLDCMPFGASSLQVSRYLFGSPYRIYGKRGLGPPERIQPSLLAASDATFRTTRERFLFRSRFFGHPAFRLDYRKKGDSLQFVTSDEKARYESCDAVVRARTLRSRATPEKMKEN